MARVGAIGEVSDWLQSAAKALPLPHRAPAPFTLGEAVAELGSYAQASSREKWNSQFSKKNRALMQTEIAARQETVGQRLGALVMTLVTDLREETEQHSIVEAAQRFSDLWHTGTALAEAFRDLCDAAKVPGETSQRLRELSAIIASQVGPSARGSFSLLSHAADMLVATKEHLAQWRGLDPAEPLTEAGRLDLAIDTLIKPPAGHVVIWTVYYRATTSQMRESVGPMTFLRADWALPNVLDMELNDFPERTELREIREGVGWLEQLRDEALKPENRLVLVRMDLGQRQVAGALEEGRRRIDAVLSVAVEAGGLSWQSAGAGAVLLDGTVQNSSLGLRLREALSIDEDSYGMSATAEVLSNIAEQLGDALTERPMPDQLIEALTSLREARMIDHRDVLFHGARPVTPRVAIALEDHAMELFASVLSVHSESLAIALQHREALKIAGRRIAGQLLAPFEEGWNRPSHDRRRELEEEISKVTSDGVRIVSMDRTVMVQSEIRALPMSVLQRADFEDGLEVCTDLDRERQFLDEILRETGILRARLRRVRNAVNHGLPLQQSTLDSVRVYADATSGAALNMALSHFKSGTSGAILLQRELDAWTERLGRIRRGKSWAAEQEDMDGGS